MKRAGIAGAAVVGLMLSPATQAWAAEGWTNEQLPPQHPSATLTTADSGGGATWALGNSFYGRDPDHTFALHRTEQGWKQVPIPNVGEPQDSAVLGPDDAWAIGDDSVHWDGRQWTRIPFTHPPKVYPYMYGVAAFRPDDVWASGTMPLPDSTYERTGTVQHWDGKRWTDIPLPDQPEQMWEFDSVSGTSGTDLWAVGQAWKDPISAPHAIVMHFDGKRWTRVRLPQSAASHTLEDVVALAGDDVWAAGRGVLLHWDGKRLTVAETKESQFPASLVPAGDTLWNVGLSQRHDANGWHQMPPPQGGALTTGTALPDGSFLGVGTTGRYPDQQVFASVYRG